jgi:hypothetical protein
MRWAVNIALLVVCLSGLFFLFRPEDRIQSNEPLFKESFLRSLQSIEIDHGEKVQLERRSEPLLFVQGEEGFAVTGSELWPVKSDNLNRLYFSLKALAPRGFVENLPEYGLDTPELRLNLLGGAGERYEIRFGREHPFSGRRYASFEGKSFLVDEALLTPLIKGDFINRQILNFEPAAVRKIRVSAGEEYELLWNQERRNWEHKYRISTERVQRYLERLTKLEALRRTDSAPEKTFELELSPLGVVKFALFDEESAWLSVSGSGYLLDRRALRVLAPKFEEFLDRRIFGDSPNPILRGIEVLSVEQTPGRIFPGSPPSCSLEGSDGERLLVFAGDNSYIADVGRLHLTGTLSPEQFKRFCQEVKQL